MMPYVFFKNMNSRRLRAYRSYIYFLIILICVSILITSRFSKLSSNNKLSDIETSDNRYYNVARFWGIPQIPDFETLPIKYTESYRKSKQYISLLTQKGLESVDEHNFKSPYIVDPPYYLMSKNFTIPKPPGYRKKKLISVVNIVNIDSFFGDFVEYDFSICPYNECEVDIKGERVESADLVLFLCGRVHSLTFERPPGQIWGLACHESPSQWDYGSFDPNLFNITVTYFMKSDIWYPFVSLSWRHTSLLKTDQEYLSITRNKTKTAVWMASNCQPDRLNFVMEMQKYIQVDIFGECGSQNCVRGEEEECLKDYKFYLAFENGQCRDYVTEKFQWRYHFRGNPIPVVKGGVDYDRYFPNNSFINGNHFESPKALAMHLNDLANDDVKYASLFREKDKLTSVSKFTKIPGCSICEALHTKKLEKVSHGVYGMTHEPCSNAFYQF